MIGWWEIRRIVYNVLILFAFAATYLGAGVVVSPHLAPGEDPIEPVAVIFVIIPAYFLTANICYTFCWVVEATVRWFHFQLPQYPRHRVFWAFSLLSCLITTAPFWYILVYWIGKPVVPQ
jgi:hypothetical protein